jgi:hypothetical protein
MSWVIHQVDRFKRLRIELHHHVKGLSSAIATLHLVDREVRMKRYSGRTIVLFDVTAFRIVSALQFLRLIPPVPIRIFRHTDDLSAIICEESTIACAPLWLLVSSSLYCNNPARFSRIKDQVGRFSVL